MSSVIKNLLIFVTGAAVGSGVTYAVIKYKLEKDSEDDTWNTERTERLQKEELEKESEDTQEDEIEKERIQQIHNKPDISTLASGYHEYHDYTKDYKPEDKSTTDPDSPMYLADEADKLAEEFDGEEDDNYNETVWDNPPKEKRGPYRVLPQRFGVFEGYDTAILQYYTDGILAEENGEIVNIDDFVGEENIEALIEDEDHEIFICNPRYGYYYDVMEMLEPYYKD
jgi:hypothetical protein